MLYIFVFTCISMVCHTVTNSLSNGCIVPVYAFTDHSKAVLLLWIICVFCVLCFSCFHICSLLPCGHLLGKGWPLGSCWWCLLYFCYFPMWYPVSGVVLDCIVSWSLLSFLLYIFVYTCISMVCHTVTNSLSNGCIVPVHVPQHFLYTHAIPSVIIFQLF